MKKVKQKQNEAFNNNNLIFNTLNSSFFHFASQTRHSMGKNPILLSQNKGKSPPGCWRSPGTG